MNENLRITMEDRFKELEETLGNLEDQDRANYFALQALIHIQEAIIGARGKPIHMGGNKKVVCPSCGHEFSV